jgi:two-component system sensor histidine kinase DesK
MVTLVHVPRERPADEPIRLAPAGAITFSVAIPVVPRERPADDLIRLASAGAITFSVAVPLVVVVLFFVTEPHHLPEAAAATALYLPLHVRHVRYALREKRPRYLPLTLAAMTVIIVGATPLLGSNWFYAYSALVASILVSAPPRFSFPAVAGILVVVGVWAGGLVNGWGIRLYGGGLAIYFPVGVAVRAATVFVLVWLVGALRRVQAARTALSKAALGAERDRIDVELRETVGAELEEIVVKGVRAQDAATRGSLNVEEDLESLVEGSRRTLANARRIVHRYKSVSAAAEIEKAALLLRAAGIEVTIEVTDKELPPTLDHSLRSALRVAVAELLTEESAGPVVLKLGCASGQFQLQTVRPSTSEPAA